MSQTEKKAFAERLNRVADKLGIPEKGRNRQELFGKRFGVSQESARKWLEGESMPQLERCIQIATAACVSFEWMMTGRGESNLLESSADKAEAAILAAMRMMQPQQKYQLLAMSKVLIAPAGDDPNLPPPPPHTQDQPRKPYR